MKKRKNVKRRQRDREKLCIRKRERERDRDNRFSFTSIVIQSIMQEKNVRRRQSERAKEQNVCRREREREKLRGRENCWKIIERQKKGFDSRSHLL